MAPADRPMTERPSREAGAPSTTERVLAEQLVRVRRLAGRPQRAWTRWAWLGVALLVAGPGLPWGRDVTHGPVVAAPGLRGTGWVLLAAAAVAGTTATTLLARWRPAPGMSLAGGLAVLVVALATVADAGTSPWAPGTLATLTGALVLGGAGVAGLRAPRPHRSAVRPLPPGWGQMASTPALGADEVADAAAWVGEELAAAAPEPAQRDRLAAAGTHLALGLAALAVAGSAGGWWLQRVRTGPGAWDDGLHHRGLPGVDLVGEPVLGLAVALLAGAGAALAAAARWPGLRTAGAGLAAGGGAVVLAAALAADPSPEVAPARVAAMVAGGLSAVVGLAGAVSAAGSSTPGRGRVAVVAAAVAVVVLGAAAGALATQGAPGPGRDGPFEVLADGTGRLLPGAPTRDVVLAGEAGLASDDRGRAILARAHVWALDGRARVVATDPRGGGTSLWPSAAVASTGQILLTEGGVLGVVDDPGSGAGTWRAVDLGDDPPGRAWHQAVAAGPDGSVVVATVDDADRWVVRRVPLDALAEAPGAGPGGVEVLLELDPGQSVRALSVGPEGQVAAAVTRGGAQGRLLELRPGADPAVLAGDGAAGCPAARDPRATALSWVRAIAHGPDGTLWLSAGAPAGEDHTWGIYALTPPGELRHLDVGRRTVVSLAATPDGALLVLEAPEARALWSRLLRLNDPVTHLAPLPEPGPGCAVDPGGEPREGA